MNKKIFLLIFFFPILIAIPSPVKAQETTSSSQPELEIKENLKERLEKLVKNKSEEVKLKRAWVGFIQSIANNTLTIETKDGPKLASISAETTYVKLPKRADIAAADLEIGSYSIVMGYINGNQVLNASRITIEDEEPIFPQRFSELLTIQEYDPKNDTLKSTDASGNELLLQIDKNTLITSMIDSQIEETEIDEIEFPAKAIAIYRINKKGEEETKILLRLHLIPSLATDSEDEEVLGPEVDYQEENEESTDSSEIE